MFAKFSGLDMPIANQGIIAFNVKAHVPQVCLFAAAHQDNNCPFAPPSSTVGGHMQRGLSEVRFEIPEAQNRYIDAPSIRYNLH